MLMFLHRNKNDDDDDGTQEMGAVGDNLPLNALGADCRGISRSEEADLPPHLEN
jgi:hypothetical protein